jgi:hypothetical protein
MGNLHIFSILRDIIKENIFTLIFFHTIKKFDVNRSEYMILHIYIQAHTHMYKYIERT